MTITRPIYENLPGNPTLFIETGTYRGDSLMVLAGDPDFHRCISIERLEPEYRAAVKRFERHAKVDLYHGESPLILPKIIRPQVETLFWLDAHSGTENAGLFGECPLMAELQEIAAKPWRVKPVILIDDSFMYTDRFWREHEPDAVAKYDRTKWPTIEDIKAAIPGYVVTEVGDLLQCIPDTI